MMKIILIGLLISHVVFADTCLLHHGRLEVGFDIVALWKPTFPMKSLLLKAAELKKAGQCSVIEINGKDISREACELRGNDLVIAGLPVANSFLRGKNGLRNEARNFKRNGLCNEIVGF